MALYCMGVMCSKPGGGTSQYFFTFFFFSRCGERLLEKERAGEITVKQSTFNRTLMSKAENYLFQ